MQQKHRINCLSLFNGMSCARMALDVAGIDIDNYYSSEIDKFANKTTQELYPDTIHLGDITKWKDWDIENPDLIIFGSPCQGFSMAGKGLNFNDPRSALFFEAHAIVKHYKPKFFIMENVKMKKEYSDIITDLLGIEPILINSALLSAQNRNRLYWVGKLNNDGTYSKVPIEQPEDKGILLKDIISDWNDITERYYKKKIKTLSYEKSRKALVTINDKSKTLMTGGQNISNSGATNIFYEGKIYNITPRECLRLQTVPESIIDKMLSCGVSQAGNGFTIDVIAHLLRGLNK